MSPLFGIRPYLECNPVRAEMVARAEHWKWSSLPGRLVGDPSLWLTKPAPRDPAWIERVNEPLSAGVWIWAKHDEGLQERWRLYSGWLTVLGCSP